MPAKQKSWREKVALVGRPKTVTLETPFAGIPAGSRLFVATPRIVEDYLRRIPRGEVRTLQRMRRDLARRHRCEATCPVSTSVFLRMVAEAPIEALHEGAPVDSVAAFWRVVEPGSTVARKLSVDDAWLRDRRGEEGIESAAPPTTDARRRDRRRRSRAG